MKNQIEILNICHLLALQLVLVDRVIPGTLEVPVNLKNRVSFHNC